MALRCFGQPRPLAVNSTPAATLDWKPVDPADLALPSPRVEKDADAEVIFWEVWVTDERDVRRAAYFIQYIRMKIFNERGRDQHRTVDLPFGVRINVIDIAGRTIKPDGTIVELKKVAVFERILVKAGGLKVKAKSFAMPAVEPGAIIEYRWREIREDQIANYVRLPFQRDVPVQTKVRQTPLSKAQARDSTLTAVGSDARIARLGDRSVSFFDPSFADSVLSAGIRCRYQVGKRMALFRSRQPPTCHTACCAGRRKARKR